MNHSRGTSWIPLGFLIIFLGIGIFVVPGDADDQDGIWVLKDIKYDTPAEAHGECTDETKTLTSTSASIMIKNKACGNRDAHPDWSSMATWEAPPRTLQPGGKVHVSGRIVRHSYSPDIWQTDNLDIGFGGPGCYKWGANCPPNYREYFTGDVRADTPDRAEATVAGDLFVPSKDTELLLQYQTRAGRVSYVYNYSTEEGSLENHPIDVISKEFNGPSDKSVSELTKPVTKPLAFITKIEGKGSVWVDGVPIQPGSKNTPVAEGSRISTGPDTSIVVTFKTTAVSIVMPNSEFVVRKEKLAEADTSKIYENLIKGIARYYYHPNEKASEKFEVETDLAFTSIKGTIFNVEQHPDETVVEVAEGIVTVKSKSTGEEVTVNAGERISVTEAGFSEISPFNSESEISNWKTIISDVETSEEVFEAEKTRSETPATTTEATESKEYDKITKVRGQAATGDFIWNPQNFPGLYYDLDNDLGTEVLSATVSGGKLSGTYPYGLNYQTTAQKKDFEFENWGSYNVIGFMAEKCFAGYLDASGSIDDRLFEESGDKNVLSKKQLLKVLVDDDKETTLTSDSDLQLEDGYALAIDSIDMDGNVVTLTLYKDSTALATKRISPSKDGATVADKTFTYKKDIGGSGNVVIVAIHFKNAFCGADTNLATVDGVWQLSDRPVKVAGGTKYEKMTIKSVTDDTITMNNQGSDITLSRNKDVSLMPGIAIKTADAEELRYYVYREVTQPGIYELRGTVATDTATWTADSFAGFYYDIDDDIETERLTATVADGKLVEAGGLKYSTRTVADNFEFEDWGSYSVIGFLGEKYFAGYIEGSDSGKGYLFDRSTDKSPLAKGQLLKVLADDETERTITSNTPLMLADNYSLELKAVNPKDGRIFVNLLKDDQIVDNKMFQPSKDSAAMSDQTYYYRNPQVGNLKLVTIAVHFKNAFSGADQSIAIIDGVWQISDSPVFVAEGISFDRLVISASSSDQISMNNKDSPITLSKNKDITLAGDMHLRTANSDSLRYYTYKEEVIEETVIPPIDYQTANDLEEEEKLSKSSGGVGQMSDPAQKLKTLKDMLDAGLITEGDYNSKKAEVLASI